MKKSSIRHCVLCMMAALLLTGGGSEAKAQGWPGEYGGIMLQGFYWDSFTQSQWSKLEAQADELSQTFSLIWIPQSAYCGGQSMGYDDLYWFTNYNSAFGTEQSLRSMIQTFKAKGLETIADVVINHRKNVSSWVDFPKETYNGVTYELTSTDICANDDGGATRTWAQQNGFQLSSNNDTGEDWGGMRDLDHSSSNVQNNVKAYLKMLLDDLGYTGFRYDMVKGYSASYTGMYNSYSKPQFSVGEFWDGNATTVKNWISGTKDGDAIQSAAFDFPFRYTVRDAINNNDWTKLAGSSVMSDAAFRRYAVTFVENHDTEKRANAEQDPIRRDTLAANAFLLAMPGTPCVFLKHWMEYKDEIKAMADARRLAGICNTSTYSNMRSNKQYFANLVKTNNENRLMVVVGSNTLGFVPSEGQWKEILSGYHYRYYLARTLETAWANRSSGTYEEPFSVRLAAVSESDDARLVYTLDGSEPTATSTQAADGTDISITADCTLKVGVLVGGTVKGVITRNYAFKKVERRDITVYVCPDKVPGWDNMNFWTWGGDDTHAPANSNWPGDRITDTKVVNGRTFYYKTFTLNSDDDFVNFVFSANNGTPQTVNVENVASDKYFEILNEKSGANYLVGELSDDTGIESITADSRDNRRGIFTLDGRRVADSADALTALPRGIYIVGGRKVVR